MNRWRARLTGGRRVWWRRAWQVALGAAVLLVLRVQVAAADPGSTPNSNSASPLFTWILLIDSKGISAWNYQLSLNEGGITSPKKFFWAMLTEGCWELYRVVCAIAIWFIGWALGMSWISWLAAPFVTLGDALHQIAGSIGIIPVLLTTSAVIGAAWFLKGRHATGIWEILMACVIATLGAGVLSQPVQMVAGPNGYLVQAGQAGQEVAAAMQGDITATPGQASKDQVALLATTFIRQPTELVNWGRIVDGGPCEATYNKELLNAKNAQGGDGIRNAMDGCDSQIGNYADNPNSGMANTAAALIPSGFLVMAAAVVFAGSVVAAVVWALFLSLKLIVNMVTGILPGGSRGALFTTISELAIALALIVFTNASLACYLLVIQKLFTSSAGGPTEAFTMVDIFMLVGLIVFWKYRTRLKESAHRLAALMATRPQASPTAVPAATGAGAGRLAGMARTAASTAIGAVVARRGASQGASSTMNHWEDRRSVWFIQGTPQTPPAPPGPQPGPDPSPQPGPADDASAPALAGGSTRPALSAGPAGSGSLPAGRRPRGELPPGPTPAGPSGPSAPTPPSAPSSGGSGSRARRWGKAAAGAAARLTAAVMTSGGSEAAAKTSRMVTAARRARLAAQFARSRRQPSASAPDAHRPAPGPARRSTPTVPGGPVVSGPVLDPAPQPGPGRSAPGPAGGQSEAQARIQERLARRGGGGGGRRGPGGSARR